MVKSRYPVLDATGARGYQRKQPIDQRRCRDWLLPFMRGNQPKLSQKDRNVLYGDFNEPGPYLVLMKWNPGWFSAPHCYATDRIQMVLSGTWWINSGADFTPDLAMPVPAGGFVKRTARTFHYDGVPRGTTEPVVIAVFGIGPVELVLADPKLPAWRRV